MARVLLFILLALPVALSGALPASGAAAGTSRTRAIIPCEISAVVKIARNGSTDGTSRRIAPLFFIVAEATIVDGSRCRSESPRPAVAESVAHATGFLPHSRAPPANS
jgi:hypothetical protein